MRWSSVAPVTRGVTWVSKNAIVLNGSLNSGLSRTTRTERNSLTVPDPEQKKLERLVPTDN